MLESCQVAAFSNLPGRRGCAGPRQFPSGAQLGPAAVEALGVRGGVTNAATVYRMIGTPLPSGASVADLFAAPRVELRWKNTAGLGDLSGDTDSDGLTDADELFLYGTDPRRADTDGDGLPDASEILTGANPFDADEDGDGVPDGGRVAEDEGRLHGGSQPEARGRLLDPVGHDHGPVRDWNTCGRTVFRTFNKRLDAAASPASGLSARTGSK